MNPPLGFFLTLPAAVMANLSGLYSADLFVVYLYLLIALSLVASWRLLRTAPEVPPVLGRGLLLLAAVILSVCPADQFGQREHFLMVLVLPYLLLVALRVLAAGGPPWWAAFGLGLAAGLGFAIKPHYLLVPLALEGYRVLATRRRGPLLRPETLGLGAACAGYAGVVLLLAPDYLTRIVPYALEVYNLAYRNPLWINLWRFETVMLPLGCLVHLATRRSQKLPQFADIFFIASPCLFVAYLVQMKGWDYHLYPASVCLMLGFAAIALNAVISAVRDPGPVAAAAPREGLLTPPIAVASLVLVALLVANDARHFGYENRFTEIMTPHVERYAAGGSIAILGSNVWPAFPLVNETGVGWSSRFPTLWLLPGARQRRHAGETANAGLLDEMEAFTRNAVVADLSAGRPEVVIVDHREQKSYFGGAPFDYLDYFGQDRRFQQLWTDYVWVAEEAGFDVYRRRCAPDCRVGAE